MATRNPQTAKPKTDIEWAEFHERKAKEHRARAASSKFTDAIAKHKPALTAIYSDLKTASGKQRGMDASILGAVAEAMGMKGMTITKKVQQRPNKSK
jgi:hypothetical protein